MFIQEQFRPDEFFFAQTSSVICYIYEVCLFLSCNIWFGFGWNNLRLRVITSEGSKKEKVGKHQSEKNSCCAETFELAGDSFQNISVVFFTKLFSAQF